jgi:hypothetical protein
MSRAQDSKLGSWVSLFNGTWLKAIRLLITISLLSIPVSASAMPGLGISISFEKSSQTAAELAGELWVGVEQGQLATRTLYVKSLSDDTPQVVKFQILDRILSDGEIVTDYSKPSRISPWVKFEPEQPVVQPGEEVAVKMTIVIPEDAADQAFQTILNVNASSAQTNQGNSNAGTQAIINTSIAVETNFWLGIGDALDLVPSFDILSVDGVLLDDQKFIRIFFENTGLVTIEPMGKLQLSDPAFQDRIFEPVEFRGNEIFENQTGFVDVPVPSDTIDGFYRTFVTAESGGVRQTKLFEGELVFDAPNPFAFMDIVLRVILFLAGAVGLVFAIRILRKKNPPKPPKQKAVRENPPKPTESLREQRPEPAEVELDAWAEELRNSLREIRLDSLRIAEKYEIPEEKPKAKPKTAPKKTPVKAAQAAKTTRKRAPTSPRSKAQSKATESKK